ncbi:MAG TPA: 2-iminoacetate synthase ThiH [bacterium]|nr:2-iminoacetate synthase ThiH [bacterium]
MDEASFRKLLEPMGDAAHAALLEKARRATLQRFGRTMQVFAPVYLSNECVDTCLYCGFSRTNKIPRRTLTVDAVVAETEHLIGQGFRHVLYVAGEHPVHVSPDYLEAVLKTVRPLLASVSIEVAPFGEGVYRRLTAAGLDGVVIYQETYDRNRYAEVHVAGPKRDFEKRLEHLEDAARAGVAHIGMGILLGLANWREDALALVRHVRSLKKKYWQVEISISLPRLRPCESEYAPPHPVCDRDFLQLIAALRLALPDVGLVLSTREAPELRDALIGLGVTRMSAGSRTEPGGYLQPEESLKQFETEDHRSPAEVAAAIQSKGYEPVWKDWERL